MLNLFTLGLADILIFLLAIVLSIVLHELAHGFVALWNGDYTAKLNGRLSVNPLVHFDAIGFIMLVVVGFGYAKPVPVNPYNFKRRKLGMFTVAIAGITLNLIMAFFSVGLFGFMNWLMMRVSRGTTVMLLFRTFFQYMYSINISLFLFNLIPIYPLDGFRIIEAFTRFMNPVTKFLRDYGQYILILLVGISIVARYVSPYVPFFAYLDPLGQLMRWGSRGLSWLFESFWNLIFRVW